MKVTRPALCFSSLLLALSGCAAGEAPGAAGPDTRLHPHLKPEHKKHDKSSAGHSPRAKKHQKHQKNGSHPSPGPAKNSSEGPAPTPSPSAPTASSQGEPSPPAGPSESQVSDRAGDVQGVGAPSSADLTGATLTANGGYTLVATVAAALPTSSSDKTMHVILFADVDGDGQIDYENWATLADNGWSGAWRYPDGAKFGGASGIDVSVSGSRLTMRFPADHVGNASHFRWLVGAEYGSDAQMASGTQSSDYAPDDGSVDFPAR